jgi:hypothetical protein
LPTHDGVLLGQGETLQATFRRRADLRRPHEGRPQSINVGTQIGLTAHNADLSFVGSTIPCMHLTGDVTHAVREERKLDT